jgi:hypothetical protein
MCGEASASASFCYKWRKADDRGLVTTTPRHADICNIPNPGPDLAPTDSWRRLFRPQLHVFTGAFGMCSLIACFPKKNLCLACIRTCFTHNPARLDGTSWFTSNYISNAPSARYMPSIVNLSIGQALQERLEFLLALLARQYLDWFASTLNE